MPQVNQLSTQNLVQGNDLLLIYSSQNSDTRKISVNALSAFINQSGGTPSVNGVQEVAESPSASGFVVSLPNVSNDIWLVLTPTGDFASGIIVMPALSSLAASQAVIVSSTKAISNLTISATGVSLGPTVPTTMGAGGFFTLRYSAANVAWYRAS